MGWVGATNGILVFDPTGGPITNASQIFGQHFNGGNFANGTPSSGFAALASLVQSSATTFSAATSLTDANTGQLYWNEVEVWVDANQNGVSDPGELYTLSDLGITSINLAATTVDTAIGGNAVLTSGSYTTSDGATHTIDDIGLATTAPTFSPINPGTSAAALTFAEIVAAGLPASAAGQAQAAATALSSQATSFSTQIAAMRADSISRSCFDVLQLCRPANNDRNVGARRAA